MVSVIIPVYNVKDYLSRCIESVLGQTCADWELILVDDGSTDGSGEICDAYSARDARIRTIHIPNGGVSVARNTGLEASSGEWISFIDSDDYVSPSYIDDMLSVSDGVDIVVSGWKQQGACRYFPDMTIRRENYVEVFIQKAFINVCAKLFRKTAVVKAAAKFDADVKWAEDSIFFINVLLSSSAVRLNSNANYFYELRDNSAVGHINSYENELAAFNAVNSLMPEMVEVCTDEARKYFGPYLFLLRTYQTVRQMDINMKEKLRMLRAIRFDKKYLYYNPISFNEKLITWLFMHKQWRILLRMNK